MDFAVPSLDDGNFDLAVFDCLRGQVGARHRITPLAIVDRNAVGNVLQLNEVQLSVKVPRDFRVQFRSGKDCIAREAQARHLHFHTLRQAQGRPCFLFDLDVRLTFLRRRRRLDALQNGASSPRGLRACPGGRDHGRQGGDQYFFLQFRIELRCYFFLQESTHYSCLREMKRQSVHPQ